MQTFGQQFHCCLGCAVDSLAGNGCITTHAGYVCHITFGALQQLWQEGLNRVDGAIEVDIDHAFNGIKFKVVHLDERLNNSCHIHQCINLTVLGDHCLGQCHHLGAVSDVEGVGGELGVLASQLFGFFQTIGVEVYCCHSRTFSQELKHQLTCDAVTATGHYEYFACNLHENVQSGCSPSTFSILLMGVIE